VTFVSSTQLTATTPAAANQSNDSTVGVTVVNPNLQQGFLAQAYSYHLPPSISTVSPATGPASGGNAVTITGQNFRGAPAVPVVTFGGSAATSVVFNSGTKLSMIAPAHAAGPVTVVVTDADGQTTSLSNGYTFKPPPTVTGVSPATGSSSGGTAVTITGTNFVNAAGLQVQFGTNNALGIVYVSSTKLTATTPAATNQSNDSTVGITVVNPDSQQGFLAQAFAYHLPPSISSVSPGSGPAAGGNTVTISGQNFRNLPSAPAVSFGSNAATNVIFNSGTTLTATVPAGTGGAVTVKVNDADGQSATLTSGYTYVPAPAITGVSPAAGSSSGGTVVTITGTNFTNGANLQVQFGVNNATAVTFVSATQVKATTPAAANQSDDSVVGVTVINGNGQQAFLAQAYSYHLPPSITSVTPNTGSTAGGNTVTITGQNFRGAPSVPGVLFGANAATGVVFNSGTTLTATVPAGTSGAVTVKVNDADGQSATLASGYTYVPGPTISSLSPATGSSSGGTVVTITGTNFTNGANLQVQFGVNNAASVTFVSATQVKATTPAASNQADDSVVGVTLINGNGQQAFLAQAYSYHLPPSITSLTPNTGPTSGGNVIKLNGQNFRGLPTVPVVKFGSAAATNVIFNNGTMLTVTVPAGSGTVSVTVSDADGQSASLPSSYTYSTAPTITSVSPPAGSSQGGTTITVTGTNFVNGPNLLVQVGVNNATSTTFVSSTQVTAVTPASVNPANDSTVGVTVISGDSQQAFLASSYSYHVPPSITSVTPNSGAIGGGTNVTITGQNFRGLPTVPVVSFGSLTSPSVVFNNGTSLTAAVPAAGAAGAVTVTVTDADGQAAALANGYTYNAIGVYAILPNIAPAAGGRALQITGYGFAPGGAAKVTFGKGTAAVTVNTGVGSTSTNLVLQAPKHAPALVNVTVANPSPGASITLTNAFTFTNGPAVANISPNTGCPVGGATIALTGGNLAAVTSVLFGSASGTILSKTAGQVNVKLPAGTLGPVTVTVTGNGTQTIPNGFTYAPAVTTKGMDDVYPGIPYSLQLAACGGVAPLQWSLIGGTSLPPGLTLNPSTGLISGTPAQPVGTTAQYSFYPIFQVTDSSTPQPFSSSIQLTTNVMYGFSTAPIPANFFGMTLYDQNDWPQAPPNGVGVQVGALGKGISVSWPFIQQTQGVYNWTVLDAYVQQAANHGVDIFYSPFNFPPWAVPNPQLAANCQSYGTNPPILACTNMVNNIQDWINFMTLLVQRYAPGNPNGLPVISVYELFNEPSQPNSFTGTQAQMLQLTSAFQQVVRANNPTATILSPSFDNATYMGSYFTNGGAQAKAVDALAFHIYGKNGVDTGPEAIVGPLTENQKFVAIGNGLTALPVWDTESSWGKSPQPGLPNPVTTEPQQEAAFVARWLMLHWSTGYARAYWYAWDYYVSHPAPTPPTLDGTMYLEAGDNGGTAVTLPAGTAYQEVQTWMQGASMPAPCTANGGSLYSAIYTCNYNRSGGYQAMAVWNTNLVCKSGVCPTVNYTPNPIYIQYRDIFGGIHPITSGQPVPIGAQPILLENQATIPGARVPH
jgi:hypothetical protein